MVVDMLSVGDRRVQEVMTPRTRWSSSPPAPRLRQCGARSRRWNTAYPVRGGMSDDDVVGFIHIRDLIAPPESITTIGDLVRPILSFPTGKLVLEALTEMRGAHEHLALIIDEYGGVDGIVTLEDFLEEFVGEDAR